MRKISGAESAGIRIKQKFDYKYVGSAGIKKEGRYEYN